MLGRSFNLYVEGPTSTSITPVKEFPLPQLLPTTIGFSLHSLKIDDSERTEVVRDLSKLGKQNTR